MEKPFKINAKTREGVEVTPGQVWRDLDPRANGRHVLVLTVERGTGFRCNGTVARVCPCQPNGRTFRDPPRPKSSLSVDRMHKGSSGRALVR